MHVGTVLVPFRGNTFLNEVKSDDAVNKVASSRPLSGYHISKLSFEVSSVKILCVLVPFRGITFLNPVPGNPLL